MKCIWEDYTMSKDIGKQFDNFCKRMLKNEALNIQKESRTKNRKEVSLENLSISELNKLLVLPVYECECKKYELLDDVILITDYKLMIALENLTKEQLQIILLYYFVEMDDNQIVDF